MRSTNGWMSASSACRKRPAAPSPAASVSSSTAVRRDCLRDGTSTSTGESGECRHSAWYTGLAIASSREPACVMLKPCESRQSG